jgi:hypothetical protein
MLLTDTQSQKNAIPFSFFDVQQIIEPSKEVVIVHTVILLYVAHHTKEMAFCQIINYVFLQNKKS